MESRFLREARDQGSPSNQVDMSTVQAEKIGGGCADSEKASSGVLGACIGRGKSRWR